MFQANKFKIKTKDQMRLYLSAHWAENALIERKMRLLSGKCAYWAENALIERKSAHALIERKKGTRKMCLYWSAHFPLKFSLSLSGHNGSFIRKYPDSLQPSSVFSTWQTPVIKTAFNWLSRTCNLSGRPSRSL